MPDEVDLMLPAPAGAETPGESATPAAPPQGDDAAPHSASGEPPVSGADEPDANAQPPKPEGKGVGKRIGELVGERERESRRADQVTGILATLLTAALSPQQRAQANATQNEAPPKAEDFGNNWAAFDQAQRAYEARSEARRIIAEERAQVDTQTRTQQAQHQRAQQAAAVEQLHGVLGSQMQEAMARYPDYAEVVGDSGFTLPVNVEAAMAVSGFGGDIAYHLATHPQLVPRLARMSDMELATSCAKIGYALRAPANLSNAPAPANAARGRGSADPGYPKDATPEQHLAYTRKLAAAQKRA